MGSNLRERERERESIDGVDSINLCSVTQEDPCMVVLLMSITKLIGFAGAKVQLEREF